MFFQQAFLKTILHLSMGCWKGFKIHLPTTLPINLELSIRTLLLKLTRLLFLTSTGRCLEIWYLDIRYMVKTVLPYKFDFLKLIKNLKKGKAPPCLEVREYPQDRDSCVITSLKEYLKECTSWREKGQSQLLLSRLKPIRKFQSSLLLVG